MEGGPELVKYRSNNFIEIKRNRKESKRSEIGLNRNFRCSNKYSEGKVTGKKSYFKFAE